MNHQECREAGCLCHWIERVNYSPMMLDGTRIIDVYMEMDWVNPECPLHLHEAGLEHRVGQDPNV